MFRLYLEDREELPDDQFAIEQQAVQPLQQIFVVSERRVCRALGQPRSSQRYTPQISEAEERLTEGIVSLAMEYGRYGHRRITTLLQWEGWRVNHKWVECI